MKLPEVGDVFERKYKLLEVLGRGGFGVVYRAHQIDVDRDVAIKVLAPGDDGYDSGLVPRFMREAKLVAKLEDPHTITMFDFGRSEDGLLFMVTEYLRGHTLERLIAGGKPIEPEDVLHIAEQVVLSLREAHHHGILHRDIKPANIMTFAYIDDPYRTKLLDFGVAKMLAEDGVDLTGKGGLVGTPRYMSPEQLMGADLGPATDFYSLGLVVQELLTGDRTVTAADRQAILKARLDPTAPISGAVPGSLKPLLQRMLARDPDDRFDTADDLLSAIRTLRSGKSLPPVGEVDELRVKLRKTGVAALVTVGAVIAFFVVSQTVYLVTRDDPAAIDWGAMAGPDVGSVNGPDGGAEREPLIVGDGCSVAGQPPISADAGAVWTSESYRSRTPAPLLLLAVPSSLTADARDSLATHLMPTVELLRGVLVIASGPDELARAVRSVSASRCIDAQRILGIGLSTGAQALSAFACSHPGRLRASALVSPALREPFCRMEPTPTFVFRGGRDGRVHASPGGQGCDDQVHQPHGLVMDELRALNECGEDESVFFGDADGLCSQRACAVSHIECTAPDVGHGWPGLDLDISCGDREPGEFPLRDLLERFFGESGGAQSSPQTESSGQPGQ